MLEIEVKSVVDDVAMRRAQVEAAGGQLVYQGRLVDIRYDLGDMFLAVRDHVLRLRIYDNGTTRDARLEWKGETQYERGFKVREELSSKVADPTVIASILLRLGFVVSMEIERTIAQYELDGAVVRFEDYPDMDALVEVEGPEESIARAIEHIGLPREGFTSDRLPEFVARFEARTGRRASLSPAELAGDRHYRRQDA